MSTKRCCLCWYIPTIHEITGARDYSDQLSNPLRLTRMRCLTLAVEQCFRAILKSPFKQPAITEIEICNYKYQTPDEFRGIGNGTDKQ